MHKGNCNCPDCMIAFHKYMRTTGSEKITPTFKRGDRVEKISGSRWKGRVVGEYSTALTPEGYAVESETETGSVQIYPKKALRIALKAGGEGN